MSALGRLLLAGALALAACGDGLVDADYHGEALLELTGTVYLLHAPPDAPEDVVDIPTGDLLVAVFWSEDPDGDGTGKVVTRVEQQAVTTSEFPASYVLSLYNPPPDEVLKGSDEDGYHAIGLVLVYVDVDGDGLWEDETDALVGGAEARAIAWATDDAKGPWEGSLGAAGYHRVRVRGDAPPCEEAAEPKQLELDDEDLLDLTVHTELPSEALVDVDCDGLFGEWGGLEPPPKEGEGEGETRPPPRGGHPPP